MPKEHAQAVMDRAEDATPSPATNADGEALSPKNAAIDAALEKCFGDDVETPVVVNKADPGSEPAVAIEDPAAPELDDAPGGAEPKPEAEAVPDFDLTPQQHHALKRLDLLDDLRDMPIERVRALADRHLKILNDTSAEYAEIGRARQAGEPVDASRLSEAERSNAGDQPATEATQSNKAPTETAQPTAEASAEELAKPQPSAARANRPTPLLDSWGK